MLSRRAVGLGILASAGLARGRPAAAAELKTIDLPPPWKDGGKPLAEALWARHSIREFADRAVPIGVLSNLLWSAYGINRPASCRPHRAVVAPCHRERDLRRRRRWRVAL